MCQGIDKNTDTSILKRELKYYSLIKSTMNELVVEYDRELVKRIKVWGWFVNY